jgi:hypothetical protein
MKKSDFKKLIKEEIIKILKEELNLNNLKIGQSVKITTPTELSPFNLKLSPSGHAISDLPELEGMIFNYQGNYLTKIK